MKQNLKKLNKNKMKHRNSCLNLHKIDIKKEKKLLIKTRNYYTIIKY